MLAVATGHDLSDVTRAVSLLVEEAVTSFAPASALAREALEVVGAFWSLAHRSDPDRARRESIAHAARLSKQLDRALDRDDGTMSGERAAAAWACASAAALTGAVGSEVTLPAPVEIAPTRDGRLALARAARSLAVDALSSAVLDAARARAAVGLVELHADDDLEIVAPESLDAALARAATKLVRALDARAG